MEADPAAGVGVFAALAAGVVSFLSPCVLPLVPGYLSAVTGVAPTELDEAGWRRVLVPSLLFVASFSAIFILSGLTATAIGETLSGEVFEKISAALIVALGAFFIAAAFITRLNREWRVDALMERAGRGGPVVAGAAFAIAWTPCVGPTLAAILGLAATQQGTGEGAALLAVYSAGLGVPFLLSAVGFTAATRSFRFLKRHWAAVQAGSGVVLIAMGVLVFTGELFRLNIEAQQFLDGLGLNFFQDV
jgi:cytochrome c-type biogenesis protein